MKKPIKKPNSPLFSSGPCKKRPGWNINKLDIENLGRSHRAKAPKAKLNEVIDLSKKILKLPESYKVGIIAGSDTGAIEAAMWSLLGKNPVDVLYWESFGADWLKDITDQLKISKVNTHKADYGKLPDLKKVNFDNDVVFTWNGTTSGVCVPNADWIPSDRKGLTICDATSAVFSMDMDCEKLDVITWSWQKVLGGEAAHGMIALSPRALERLSSYAPQWPIPKIYRLANNKKIIEGIFKGETINTPSMLCVADVLDALYWLESIGGLDKSIKRSKENLDAVKLWVNDSKWAEFLCDDPKNLSCTSICIKVKDSTFLSLDKEEKEKRIKEMNSLLEKEQVAYDINAYRTAPLGFRIWGGATVDTSDIENLLPWLDWAYNVVNQ